MQKSSNRLPKPEGKRAGLTLSAQSKRGALRWHVKLFLAYLLDAIQESWREGARARRPKDIKATVAVHTKCGAIQIPLLRPAGGWTEKLLERIQSTLKEQADLVWVGATQCLESEAFPRSSLKALVTRLVGRVYPPSRMEAVIKKMEAFLADYAICEKRNEAKVCHASAIIEQAEARGFSSSAISVTPKGPRARLVVIFSQLRLRLPGGPGTGEWAALQERMNAAAVKFKACQGNLVFLPTENNPHGRRTYPGYVVDFEQLGVRQGGLLTEVLDAMPTPVSHQYFQRLMRHVEWICATSCISQARVRAILSSRSDILQEDDLQVLTNALISCCDARPLEPRSRSGYLSAFQEAFHGAFQSLGTRASKVQLDSTKHWARRSRGLISEVADPGAISPENRPPIIHVVGGDGALSRERAAEHLEDRLKRIENACDHALAEFINWRKFMLRAGEMGVDDSFRSYVDQMKGLGDGREGFRQWLRGAATEDIARVTFFAAQKHELYREARDRELRSNVHQGRFNRAFGRISEEYPELVNWCGGRSSPFYSFAIQMIWWVPRWVQLAIEMKIQIVTSWNRDTVKHLEANGVRREGARLEFQSLKGKNGEMENASVEPVDKLLQAGIDLMIEHNANVDRYWSRESPGLFVTFIEKGVGRRVFGRGTDHKILSRFIAYYELPHFTREQLRNQSAGADYLSHDDPHATQGRLGHTSIRTTAGYLDGTVFRVLNSANIAKFQKVLSASIVWAAGGEDAVTKSGMPLSYVDKRLLFPVSDSAVTDRLMPPECDVWMVDPEQPLVLDKIRVMHLIRQRAYYAQNWQRLRAESSERFSKVHLPRIEFTAALWALISDSEYACLLEQRV